MCKICENGCILPQKVHAIGGEHSAVIRDVEARSLARLLGFAISDLSGSLSVRPSSMSLLSYQTKSGGDDGGLLRFARAKNDSPLLNSFFSLVD